MGKPRVIIADTDPSYIIPLQLKFVEEFFDQIELEIITDKDYFNRLFSLPQQAGVLILSEDLYDRTLHRHTVDHVFLMLEHDEDDVTTELSISKLYKYTSIKEIFGEILGKSADALNIAKTSKKEPQIILVTSACGGTGKTTLSMALGVSLVRNYKRVLYINAHRLQNFQYVLEAQAPISDTEVYLKLSGLPKNSYNEVKHVIRSEVFHYLPPFKASLMSLGLDYQVFLSIAQTARQSGDFDFIIVDADSTFDEKKANLLGIADKVVIVTRQNRTSVCATNLLASNIMGINAEKYIFVCNDFDKNQDNSLISPSNALQFAVNEYIAHFGNYDQMKCSDFSKDKGIQKIAFLIM